MRTLRLGSRFVVVLFFAAATVLGTVAAEPKGDTEADPADLASLAERVDDGSLVLALSARMRAADAAERAALEKALLAVATDEKATGEGRRAACHVLAGFASGAAVPALAPLLVEDSFSHAARFVFESAPGAAVEDALLAAMEKTKGATRLGLIDSLAVRRSEKAVRPLARLAADRDVVLAAAAIRALGAIGERTAFRALGALRPPGGLQLTRTEAQLVAAQRMIETESAKKDVFATLDRLTVATQPLPVRTAAWRLLLQAQPEKRVQRLADLFAEKETALHAIAARSLGMLEDESAREKLVARADAFPADSIDLLLEGLSARGSRSILPLVRRQRRDPDEARTVIAIRALGRVGEDAHFKTAISLENLLEMARTEGAVATAAREAIAVLPDRHVDDLLLGEFAAVDSSLRPLLPGLLADRACAAAVPVLMKAGPGAERGLMQEIYKAVGTLADEQGVPPLLERWDAAPSPEQTALERAIVAIGRRVVSGTVARMVAPRLKATEAEARVAAIRILGAIADETCLSLLEPFVDAAPPEENALRAVVAWRTADALPVLARVVARGDLGEETRVTAWKAMLRLANTAYEGNRKEGARAFQECMSAAFRSEDRLSVIAAVEKLQGSDIAGLLRGWVLRPDVRNEAVAALERVLAREREN